MLSEDLRSALGISRTGPPPWLARMRALGYPPGYRSSPCYATHQPQSAAACSLGLLQAQRLLTREDWHGRKRADEEEEGAADAIHLVVDGDDVPEPADDDMQLGKDALAANTVGHLTVCNDWARQRERCSPLCSFAVGDEDASTADGQGVEGAQLVAFPGLNAPLPEDADPAAWQDALAGADSATLSLERSKKRARVSSDQSYPAPQAPMQPHMQVTRNLLALLWQAADLCADRGVRTARKAGMAAVPLKLALLDAADGAAPNGAFCNDSCRA